ncbi:hypothetical protein [Actinomadura violacea]|uniref:Uncharacterized protein n=1 Tax=Actinomadura violacea TaxID=2819934 RepID=A0ABS3RZJ2_9ACTN|nr:hypothetical protein [Actinomadura violacea]MBO2461723.1 hypothetical protein [Actinomadura violacea]
MRARWEYEIPGCARDARDVAMRARAMHRDADSTTNVFTVIDGDGAETVVDLDEGDGPYTAARRAKLQRTVLHIVAVETDDFRMDCCDTDPVHVWVVVSTWSTRRAVQVQGTQFAQAAGCAPEELVGLHFMADLPYGEPPFKAEPAERIEFARLEACPPIEEVDAWLEEHSNAD